MRYLTPEENKRKQQMYRDMSIKVEGEDFMNDKKLPLIQKITPYELDSFMKRDDICRGELFYNEDTGEIYMVDKGDVETYWLRVNRINLKKQEEEKEREKFKYELEQNENPFLN